MANFRRKNSPAASTGSIDISEVRGVRFLHFGSDWVQGAMRVARPWALELSYTREMMWPLLLGAADQWPRSVLMIGLGAGSQLKFLHRHLPDCRFTVVEINPQVEYVARQYFNVPDDPRRIEIVIGDGAEYVLRGGKSFDLILVDGFDADACTGALDSQPFYQACRARLEAGGLFSINLLGRNRGFAASVERLQAAFDNRLLVLPPCDSGNVIALAHGETAPLTLAAAGLRQRAAALAESSGLDLAASVERLIGARIAPAESIDF